jgi:hypothetical protein
VSVDQLAGCVFSNSLDLVLSDPNKPIQGLDQFMRNSGFDARLSKAIEREMSEKWILLAGLGGINWLMRGTVGEVTQAFVRSPPP